MFAKPVGLRSAGQCNDSAAQCRSAFRVLRAPFWFGTQQRSVAGVWKEAASGAKDDRAQRKKVMALAQARDVDVVLVSELTR